MTRGQYDYIRKKSLDTLQTKLGPMEKVLFKGKTVHEAVRIVRSGAIPATDGIVKEAARFSKVAKLATRGNVVLGAVGVGMIYSRYGNRVDLVGVTGVGSLCR